MITRDVFWFVAFLAGLVFSIGLFAYGQTWEKRGNRYGVWCQIVGFVGAILTGVGLIVFILIQVSGLFPSGGLR